MENSRGKKMNMKHCFLSRKEIEILYMQVNHWDKKAISVILQVFPN